MPALLDVLNLRKRFGGITALDNASFSIDTPGIVGLIGPNGAGKTTLFDIVCGRQGAESGEIRFEGRRIDGLRPHHLARLGFARSFQECRLMPEETCLDNLLFAAQDKRLGSELAGLVLPKPRPRERARSFLATTGLEQFTHVPAGGLSFGQRRLIEILSVLMACPRILLLDEPASGVNPTLLGTLHGLLRRAASEVSLLLVIEHNMEFVMSLAGRVIVMHQGSVLADGSPAEVQADARVIDAYLG